MVAVLIRASSLGLILFGKGEGSWSSGRRDEGAANYCPEVAFLANLIGSNRRQAGEWEQREKELTSCSTERPELVCYSLLGGQKLSAGKPIVK